MRVSNSRVKQVWSIGSRSPIGNDRDRSVASVPKITQYISYMHVDGLSAPAYSRAVLARSLSRQTMARRGEKVSAKLRIRIYLDHPGADRAIAE
jgi:hypothetical protein